MNTIEMPESQTTPATRKQAIEALTFLKDFMGPAQQQAVIYGMRGEERQFFYDKMVELADRIRNMPKSYEQDGLGDKAIAYLHYFTGGRANWWITEKDMGCDGDTVQHQAFGKADLFGDGGELGYISIVELLSVGAELDFHFTPKPLSQIN